MAAKRLEGADQGIAPETGIVKLNQGIETSKPGLLDEPLPGQDSVEDQLQQILRELGGTGPEVLKNLVGQGQEKALSILRTVAEIVRGPGTLDIKKVIGKKPNLAARFSEQLTAAELTEQERQKLEAMIEPNNYRRAVQAVREIDGKCRTPHLNDVLSVLTELEHDELITIAQTMERPRIVIATPLSLQRHIKNMRQAPHGYYSADGKLASVTCMGNEDEFASYDQARVSIIDAIPSAKKPEKYPRHPGPIRNFYTENFLNKGVRHIDWLELFAAIQMSLIEAEELNDPKLILDKFTGNSTTATIINPACINNDDVHFAHFIEGIFVTYFRGNKVTPGEKDISLRGRPAFTLAEYDAYKTTTRKLDF